MTLQVDQDGAVALPLALGPIINAEDPNRFLDWEGLAAQETKEMSRTGFHTKRSRQPAAAFPTQRKADRTQGVRQLSSTTTTSLDERRHALAEDAARTGTITTEEAARVETQDHPGAATGKIVHNAHVLTVDVAGPPRAERTASGAALRCNVEEQRPLSTNTGDDTKGRKVGQEVGGIHSETP
jgi:hypothetical protein